VTQDLIRRYPAEAPGAPWLVFGHGAGAGHDHSWMRRAAAGLAARGVGVATFDFPYMAAHRKVPDAGNALEAAFARVWQEIAASVGPVAMFAGGKSMGGRIASQAAAKESFDPSPAGLVYFGYPLHPPGRPAQRRDRHLPAIAAPMLFIQGSRDPFGSPEEMQALAATLPTATLALMPGGDHSLVATKRDDPGGTLLDRALDLAAEWMRARAPAHATSGSP
jgi:predicted alpha/beta-hydrolase family hydrolase